MKRKYRVVADLVYETDNEEKVNAEIEAETLFISKLGDNLVQVHSFEGKGSFKTEKEEG